MMISDLYFKIQRQLHKQRFQPSPFRSVHIITVPVLFHAWCMYNIEKAAEINQRLDVSRVSLWRLSLTSKCSCANYNGVKWAAGSLGRRGSEGWTAGCLTRNLHHVTGDHLPGFDPLHALPVRPVNFAHLGLVLLQRLDGTLCVSLLSHGGIRMIRTLHCGGVGQVGPSLLEIHRQDSSADVLYRYQIRKLYCCKTVQKLYKYDHKLYSRDKNIQINLCTVNNQIVQRFRGSRG